MGVIVLLDVYPNVLIIIQPLPYLFVCSPEEQDRNWTPEKQAIIYG